MFIILNKADQKIDHITSIFSIPIATWTAVIVFVSSSLLAWVLRIIDRKRQRYRDRLETIMGILETLRKLMDIFKNEDATWTQRSLVESELTRHLLTLKKLRRDTSAVRNWVTKVSESIKYDELWQNTDIYEECIAQPLLLWVETDKSSNWFLAQVASDRFNPAPR